MATKKWRSTRVAVQRLFSVGCGYNANKGKSGSQVYSVSIRTILGAEYNPYSIHNRNTLYVGGVRVRTSRVRRNEPHSSFDKRATVGPQLFRQHCPGMSNLLT